MKFSNYLAVLFTCSWAHHLGARGDEDAFVVPPPQQADVGIWTENWVWPENSIQTISWKWQQPYDHYVLSINCCYGDATSWVGHVVEGPPKITNPELVWKATDNVSGSSLDAICFFDMNANVGPNIVHFKSHTFNITNTEASLAAVTSTLRDSPAVTSFVRSSSTSTSTSSSLSTTSKSTSNSRPTGPTISVAKPAPSITGPTLTVQKPVPSTYESASSTTDTTPLNTDTSSAPPIKPTSTPPPPADHSPALPLGIGLGGGAVLLILVFVVVVKIAHAQRSRQEHSQDLEPKFAIPYDSEDRPQVPGWRFQQESCPPRLPAVRVPGEIRAYELYAAQR